MFTSQIGGLALNRRKWPEMGPEWSPGPENRPPGMPRPFSRLWDRSRGPKPTNKFKKLPVWGLALGSLTKPSATSSLGTELQHHMPTLFWSECGTWSHAVISSLGARARGGWSGSDVSVSHIVRPGLSWTQVSHL